MKKLILALFVIIGSGLQAQTDVYFNIDHFLGVTPFAFNTTGTNNINQDFQVTRLEYYIAEVKLIHDGGTETMVPDFWLLVDASSKVKHLLGSFNVTNLEAIEFGIGVENAYNHLDPATYTVFHPLGPKSPSMHWGWSSGYRFLAMEGKAGSNMSLTFEIHALGDLNYHYVNLPTTGVNTGSEININIDANYEMALKGISVSSGPLSHSETGISATALLNFNTDVFAIGAGAPNGMNTISSSSVVNLYPNPSTGTVSIDMDENITGDVEVVIMDVTGQVVLRKAITEASNSFVNIANNGLYLVNVFVDGQNVSTKRVVIFK